MKMQIKSSLEPEIRHNADNSNFDPLKQKIKLSHAYCIKGSQVRSSKLRSISVPMVPKVCFHFSKILNTQMECRWNATLFVLVFL